MCFALAHVMPATGRFIGGAAAKNTMRPCNVFDILARSLLGPIIYTNQAALQADSYSVGSGLDGGVTWTDVKIGYAMDSVYVWSSYCLGSRAN